jgi:predicted acylesterase/phospholipase RssA
MAIKNFLSSLIVVSLFALTACKSPGPKRPVGVGQRPEAISSPTSPVQPQPQTPQGTRIGGLQQPEEPIPQPQRYEAKKVAVILGPGGAKAFAHVGVLKALQQQRIPIEKVIGLEWGALIGGMYAIKGQVHDVEWKLYKMQQMNLFEPKGFFNRKATENSISILDEFISQSFGNEEISRSKVSFACPAKSLMSGVISWQNRGPYRDVLKRCLLYQPNFKPQGTFIAAPSAATEAVDWLVREGFNVIIFVNVLGSGMPVAQDALRDNLNYVILWQEIKRSLSETSRLNIDTINVDTSNYPMTQFPAQKELIAIGESAGNKAAGALIQKYGF